MTVEKPDLHAVFNEAIALASQEDRAHYVEQACGDDSQLKARVHALLQAHSEAGDFFGGKPTDPRATELQLTLERPGAQIGLYKLLQQIGEGGFGVVFMAEQLEPLRRKVALKVIKPGMDTRQVIARFEAERQALAVMDHPNIARVLDAGATQSGRPYFVMELVRGTPITQYCDENNLPVRERLELFATVCRAIQHAHTKGIIHRDVKPTNVLVTRQDGQPLVKVIDFGIAKAMGQALTDKTLFTDFAQMIGTPLYMSPEQAELSATDIDTRCDIYSLGVLLYELLTGSTPVSQEQLGQAAFDEIRRIIREDDPPKPSMRLSTAQAAPSIAAQRHTEPAKLTRLVRGELDWIVMKALEKDRNRRYETANGFAADVLRYLADEPVQACPPSASYRLQKLVRRNKGLVLAASLVLAALVIGIMGTTWGMIRATHAEAEAVRETVAKTTALTEKEAALELARKSELAAQTQEALARENAEAAREQESIARQRYYAAQINLAQQAGQAGRPARMLELLEGQRPKFDEDDLRGFEWYYLWRQCHQNLHRILRGPAGQVVYTLAVTPDGKTLASGSSDGVIRLWDVATGEVRAALAGHASMVWRLAISPDGKLLASASEDLTVKLWNLESTQLLDTLGGRTDSVLRVAFSLDGNVLAVGTRDGVFELWDVATRKRLRTLSAEEGKLIRGVMVRDMTLEPPRLIFQGELSNKGASSPDGKLSATCDTDAMIWSFPSGELKATLDAPHSSHFVSVVFSADGNSVILGGSDRTVKLWEFNTGATRNIGVHRGKVHAVVVIPRSDLVASAGSDGTAKIWRTGVSQKVASVSRNGAVRSLAFTPDSKRVVVGSDRATVVIDAASGEELTRLPVTGALSASADANLLAAYVADDKPVIWDVASARARAALPVGTKLAGVAFSRDGKMLATWSKAESEKGSVILWDLPASQVRLTFQLDNYGSFPPMIYSAAFSSDGRTLAIASQFGSVTLWDTTSGRQQMTLKPFVDPTHGAGAVGFSNDGKMLAASDGEGTLRLWNVETGELQASLKGHAARIGSVAFSPDDRRLLSGGNDKTARIWDVVTGQELYTFPGHKSSVHLVAFAPDGKRVATASHNVVKLWLAATEPEATAFRVELDSDDPDSPRAANLWGDRLVDSDQLEEAEAAYGRAQARLEKLTVALPIIPDYRRELAYSLIGTALLSLNTKRPRIREQIHLRVRDIYQTLDSDQKQNLGDSFAWRSAAVRRLGRWEETANLLAESVELVPGSRMWRAGRRQAQLELENWQEDCEELAVHVESPDADGRVWYEYALLCLHLGQKANYQMACNRMLDRFGQSAGTDAYWTVWTSVLGPDAGVDWAMVVRLAETAHAEGGSSYDKINHLGAVLYRAGKFEEAAQRFSEAEVVAARSPKSQSSIVYNWLFQAMVHHHLGNNEIATNWLKKAVQAIDAPTQGNKTDPWNRRLTLRLLRTEAEALLAK